MKTITPYAIELLQKNKFILKNSFKNHLISTISNLTLTDDFIYQFKDMNIDFSEYSLTPGAIWYLDELGLFNYNMWAANIEKKDISILLDDNFIEKYNPDISDIIIRNITKNIPDLFKKYFDKVNADAKLKLLNNYGTYDDIIKNIDITDTDILKNIAFRTELGKDPNKVLKDLMTCEKEIDLMILVYILNNFYVPDVFSENINDVMVKVNKDTAESMDEALSEDESTLVYNIIYRYPVEALSKFIDLVDMTYPSIINNYDFLRSLLILRDNLSEDLLVNLAEKYVQNDLREELENYANNYNYTKLLTLLRINF